jgi:superfamily II DNA or RNA helicase
MTSYDRLFPNQDTMPKGGFGNLIALPLQYQPRQAGNTVFLDESWEPHVDQWAYLGSYSRIAASCVDELAREATEKGQVVGVRTPEPAANEEMSTWLRRPSSRKPPMVSIPGPVPEFVHVVLSRQIFVDKRKLPASLVNQVKRLAAFQNPEFYKKQAMRLSTAFTPRIISCAEDLPHHVGLPRGCFGELRDLLDVYGIGIKEEDQRYDGNPLDVQFHGDLTPIQDDAVSALLAYDIGVFIAPPGSGKTVVGVNSIARRGRNTLVLVHRTQLLDQWRAQLSVFLDLRPTDIGQIGGGKHKVTGNLDVAMIQSLVRKDGADDLVARYGHVVVDECHHVPAVSFERVMREVRARYVTGLTATPQRRDGHHPILEFQLGPVRYCINPRSQAARRPFEHRLILRDTSFHLEGGGEQPGIQEIYRQLAANEARNTMILDDVVQALVDGRSPIVLTERREHVKYFAAKLGSFTRHLVVLQGGMGAKQRREIIDQLADIPDDEERLVIATGRFLGEGFDDARLDTLFLALPVSWKGTLVQYAGRLHRKHRAKSEVRIFDYVDRQVPILAKMFDKRLKGYRSMGYELDIVESPSPSRDDYIIEYDQDAPREPDIEDGPIPENRGAYR